jgi:hypothetical protein
MQPVGPAPRGLAGTWKGVDGDVYEFKGAGPTYDVRTSSAAGVANGSAELEGSAGKIVLQLSFIGPVESTCELSPDNKRLTVTTTLLGVRVSTELRRVWWP